MDRLRAPQLRVTSVSDHLNSYLFREFNGGGAPAGAACPGSTINETFETGALSTDWQQVTPNACAIAVDTGPSLRMTFADTEGTHACRIETSTAYNLRDVTVEVTVEVVPSAATNVEVAFVVETRTARAQLRLDATQRKLIATYELDGVGVQPVGSVDVDLSNLAPRSVWRLSGTDDDRLVFEVGDGETFEVVGATQLGVLGTLDVVRVKLGASGAGDGGGAGARFRSIRSR